jgi:uncharacterized surface protein with fasciclin (FAS1) repeats
MDLRSYGGLRGRVQVGAVEANAKGIPHMLKFKSGVAAIALAAGLAMSSAAFAQDNPMVGGAEMMASKNIVENASKSKDHTTLVSAVKQADLVDTLSGEGPFTVFAPTDAAFEKLPDGTVEGLMKDDAKKDLSGILTYHVVSGKMNAKDIMAKAKENDGKVELKTVNGATLTVMVEGDDVTLTDAAGGKSKVTIADVNQSNGVIHVIDTVLMPKG